MKKISLTKGFYAYVDDNDFDFLNQWNWTYMKVGKSAYAYRTVRNKLTKKAKSILMHRIILNPPEGLVCDHVDGNGLNNQRSNLRLATRSQNCANSKTHIKTKTGVKGIYPINHADGSVKYTATMCVNYKMLYFGIYDTIKEAKLAWTAGAKQYQGEFTHE